MRWLRVVLILSVMGQLAWVLSQSMSVQSNEQQVQITIDRQKLRQAGSELTGKSRRAIGTIGNALEQAGHTLGDTPRQDAPLLHR